MKKLLDLYLTNFIRRFDKDGIIPYLSSSDFEGMQVEQNYFCNSNNHKIAYFYYFYENYRQDKLILFLHGIGPGHTAYMAEINRLCKAGYRVLTLDYTGCDKSEGENLYSINQPTKDVDELLKTIDYSGEIMVVGHSLGGYTTLNTLNLNNKIRKGVVISGFFSFKKEVNALFRIPFLSKPAIKYESDKCQNYNVDNFKYLKTTDDKILFIHSVDDKIVPYKSAAGFLKKKINNKNLSYLVVSDKGHNPNYTVEAIKYMNDAFAEYGAKIKSNELKTFEEKAAFMSDKSALKMTIQDDDIWEKILDYLS